jgi:hypothetical protein
LREIPLYFSPVRSAHWSPQSTQNSPDHIIDSFHFSLDEYQNEAQSEGVLLRPVVTLPVEIYTPERKAEFLLNNTITPENYAAAVKKVRSMGLDPETITHKKPEGA